MNAFKAVIAADCGFTVKDKKTCHRKARRTLNALTAKKAKAAVA